MVGLPDLVGEAQDAELFHPVAQGIGVQSPLLAASAMATSVLSSHSHIF
jgi:hypothetical protein